MSTNNQMLAVWGSPGAGKTVTAVKLAMELAAHKKNVVILMCDSTVPAPQTLLPYTATDGKSLGELLALPSISQEAILSRCIPFGKSPYVSLLGHQSGDNTFSYAKYAKERAIDLITLLRHVADYIIIDCQSVFFFDILSAVVLENADAVLRLCACDLKSLSYFTSALPLLADGRYASTRHIKALSIVKPGQDSGEYSNVFGGASYSLPYVPELEEQFYAGRLTDELYTKPARTYTAVIRDIVRNVLLGREATAASENAQLFLPKEKTAKEKQLKQKLVKESPPRGIRLLKQAKPKPEKASGVSFRKLRIGKGGRP